MLLVTLALLNATEVLGFIHAAVQGLRAVRPYGFTYIALLIVIFAMMLHVSLLVGLNIGLSAYYRYWVLGIYAPVAIFLMLLFFTDQLIVDFQPVRNTVLRVPGPWFPLLEIYIVLYLLIVVLSLVYGARRVCVPATRRLRSRLWLIAMAPIAIFFIYLTVAHHFGFTRQISSTIYGPLVMTIPFIIAGYATYHHRLFDFQFFIPGSRVRKEKEALYDRIEAGAQTISDARSLRRALGAIANALECSVGMADEQRRLTIHPRGVRDAPDRVSDIELTVLRAVDTLTVAEEIRETQANLYLAMTRSDIAAIVPMETRAGTVCRWLLLGKRFSEQVYTPLDFRVVERLFERLAERSREQFSVLRAQLARVTRELQQYQRRLDTIEAERRDLKLQLSRTELENSELRSRSEFKPAFWTRKALEDYVAEFEKEIIGQALAAAQGNISEAARLLDMRANTLFYKIKRYGLSGK